MDSEDQGDIDTYFKRLEEDKAFAEELKKYMGESDEGEEEAEPKEESGIAALKEAPPPPKKKARPTTRARVAEATSALQGRLEFLEERRKITLTRLWKSRKDLREAWKALAETQGNLENSERKLGEFRSQEDQNLARIEDLQDGLERLRQAYDTHLKITTRLKSICDKLLKGEGSKKE